MDIERLKALIAQREALDAEIVTVVTGVKKERKPQACSTCGEVGHSTRTCPRNETTPGAL